MDKERLIRQLMATFLDELEDHVRTLNRDLLALEKGPRPEERPELLRTVFRAVHSLKGAARSVGAAPIEESCHCLEDVLAPVLDGRRPLTTELLQLLFSATDAVERAGRLLREGRELGTSPLAALLSTLRAAAGRAPAGPEAAAEPPRGVEAEESTLRVSAAKIDSLLAHGGELLVARRRLEARGAEAAELSEAAKERARRGAERAAARGEDRLAALARRLERFAAGLAADLRSLERSARPLEEDLRLMRMVPFSSACGALERGARDLAKSDGKDVSFLAEGGEVELDRAVLEALRAPLLHLVRNAVAHGIERPAARRAAGKPERGAIAVAAALRDGRVEITVGDDGRGVDLPAVREQAQRRSIPAPADDEGLARLIFLPGLSTSEVITAVSGRGVGLDVVKSAVESLHGTVDVASEPGRGCRFILRVPLTLSIARAVLVSAGGQTLAFLIEDVRALRRTGPEELRAIEGRDTLFLGPGQEPVPLASLSDSLGLPERRPPGTQGRAPVVILGRGARRAGLLVDELLGEQEIVIKSLGERVDQARHVSGATVLPDGRVALILNAASLVDEALGRPSRALSSSFSPPEPAPRKRVLLVEDSVTTRSLEKNILESSGYEVMAAADGAEAWQLLQEHGADVVVSDVEMPRLDGFALTEAIRGSKRFRDLPVVLVTALEADEEKARGLKAGADAYLLKSAFDQKDLLDAIAQLL